MTIELGYSLYFVGTLIFIFCVLILFNPDKFQKLRIRSVKAGNNQLDFGEPQEEEIPLSSPVAALAQANQDYELSPLLELSNAFTDKNLEKHKAAFEKVLEQADEGFDRDFWQSLYLHERHQLGEEEALEALENFGVSNTDWVWPYTFLGRISRKTNHREEAEKYYEEAVARALKKDVAPPVLEFIDLQSDYYDDASALRKAKGILEGATTPKIRSRLLERMSDIYFDTGSREEGFVFANKSIQEAPFDNEHRFNIAYKLSQIPGDNKLVEHHYFNLRSHGFQESPVSNNLAVALFNEDKKAYGTLLTEATDLTPAISLSNLARYAADTGLLEYANQLLDLVPELDQDDQNVLAAKQHVMHAAATTNERIKHLKEQCDQYAIFCNETDDFSIKIITQHHSPKILGDWANNDIGLKVSFSESDDTKVFECRASGTVFKSSSTFVGKVVVRTHSYIGTLKQDIDNTPSNALSLLSYANSYEIEFRFESDIILRVFLKEDGLILANVRLSAVGR